MRKGVQCVEINQAKSRAWPLYNNSRMPDQGKTHQCSGGSGAHYHISIDSEGVRRRKNRQRLGRIRTFSPQPQGLRPDGPPGYQWGSMPNVGHL
ncbi:Hypothetical predicted protein [Mytilus galloprovincialis]|uniref:Uncharacterized protein n=1 Tax=Mytilus galloprovincialis TaxID=29158 RepID=A0A8B6C2E6_MYTGA|nr:Hypothetical predicted protein [Mytilus galloprovincialis]